MSLYTVVTYILYFFCYSFIGWIVESTYCSFGEKKWVNRGFLTGPVVPIYGAGTLTMAICLTPIKNINLSIPVGSHEVSLTPILVFFAGIVVCDILEFATSYIMEKLFHARWWDYSNKKFNIQGRICLQHSMYWGVGSVIFLYLIHPITEYCFSRLIEKVGYIACVVFLVIFTIDVIHATIKAMDVKNFMDKISNATSLLSDVKNGTVAKYSAAKDKVDSWLKDMNAHLKNLKPSFKSEIDEKKELPNHHLKSSPALLSYVKGKLKKLEDMWEEYKKDSE